VLSAPALRGTGETRFLGLLLCYNDDDILGPVIEHLVANHHDVVVLNHGSEDRTEEIALSYVGRGVVDYQLLDRVEVPFKQLYRIAGEYVQTTYGDRYDWLSWPDQDEILEGPDLTRPYHEQVTELLAAGHDWIEFENFVFWYTDADDETLTNPVERLRHYSLYRSASPRIRGWRMSATNERKMGNANPPLGRKSPTNFALRHYPMRSLAQARRRASHDRNQPGFQRGDKNWHYQRFREEEESLQVPAERLHRFDGAHLDPEIVWEFYARPDGV
jgi:glycosyltransferase involved in cell wall biosynthesis